MNKKIVVIIILISVVLGYLLGSKYDIFSSKSAHYETYIPHVPKELTGESVDFSDIVKSVSPAVVNISTTKTIKRGSLPFSPLFDSPFGDFFENFRAPKKWKEQSLGSGVLVSSDGYIITNNHVVEKSDEIKITLYDNQTYQGKIIGADPKTDIAILKISVNNLPAIKWGNSDGLQVGEFVLAFGNPFGFSHTVTMGIVSAVGRANVGIIDYENFIQTDAAINPGNSGGPLVNIKGELIGINSVIYTKSGGYQGIGFAVPSNMAKSVMRQLIEEGKVTRGWLGVTIQNITPELAREFGLKKSGGALVSNIIKGSPAEKARLKRGDIIIEVNSKTINDVASLRNMIAQSKVGKTIQLKVIRAGNSILLKTTIAELPKEIAERVPGKSGKRFAEKDSFAGLSVIDLTTEIAKQLGLSREEKGVVIIRVEPYSAADESGLKKGDIIQEMNKKAVNNLRDFNNIISQIRKGDTVLLFINRGGNKRYIPLRAYS